MPYYIRDPKRDHNFDNHPCKGSLIWVRACKVSGFGFGVQGFLDLGVDGSGIGMGRSGPFKALSLVSGFKA